MNKELKPSEKLTLKIEVPKVDKRKMLTKQNILELGILDKEKVEVFWHPASRKVGVGAKDNGKTYGAAIKLLSVIELNNLANAWGFRKDKDKAVTALGTYFFSVISVLERRYGIKFKNEYRKSRSIIYSLKSKTKMHKNQMINLGSLEDIQGSTDGKAPGNGGPNQIILIDEPITKKAVANPEMIPSDKAWEEDMDIMDDNVYRFNDQFAEEIGKEVKSETIIVMNDWGDHPLTREVNEAFPVEQFAHYNFGMPLSNILENEKLIDELFNDPEWVEGFVHRNIKGVYKKSNDTLYFRTTKFSKPTNRRGESREKVLRKIILALKHGNMNSLAISMGYRHQGETDDKMLSYDIRNFNNSSQEDMLKDGFKPETVVYSTDIDVRKGACITMTPTIRYVKATMDFDLTTNELIQKVEKRVLFDRQIEIPTMGSGEYGELNDLYVNMITKAMTKHYKAFGKSKPKKAVYAVDDKRKWFLNEVRKKNVGFIKGYRTFEQHGDFDIPSRQQATKIGFDNKVLYNHHKNKALENDIKVCQRADISNEKRKTSGATNYLDRIDSMENGFIEFWSDVWRSKKRKGR